MNKFEKILSNFSSPNPLTFLYEKGLSPEKVKELIIKKLDPFFTNKDILEKQSMELLVNEYVLFVKMEAANPSLATAVKKIVDYYNSAKIINADLLHSIINSQIPTYKNTGSRFWTYANHETNKLNLDLADFVEIAMTNIDNTVEGLTKVLLHENLAVHKINKGQNPDFDKIKKMDIGTILDDLISNSPYKEVFIIPSENLKLSDWRNIAAHHNYTIDANQNILCEYGKKDNRNTITITKAHLQDRLIDCVNRMVVMQTAHKFYYTDNFDKIIEKDPSNLDPNERDEVHFLRFANSVYSEGYKIINVDHQNNSAKIIVQDLTTVDPYKRSMLSLPFIYNLWIVLNSDNVTLEYQTRAGKTFFKAQTNREACENLRKGAWTFDYFYTNVKQQFL